MLVASSCCQSTSNSSISSVCPRTGVTSIWRVNERHSGDRRATVSALRMICPALAWLVIRFAVCTDEPKMSRFSSTTGPEVAADADRDVLALHLQRRVHADVVLHLGRGVHRVVGRGEDRQDLVTDGLDDAAAVALRGTTHDVDADHDHVARRQVAQHLVEARAAHDVREQDGDLRFRTHRRADPLCATPVTPTEPARTTIIQIPADRPSGTPLPSMRRPAQTAATTPAARPHPHRPRALLAQVAPPRACAGSPVYRPWMWRSITGNR